MSLVHRARLWRRRAVACGMLVAVASLALPAEQALARPAPTDPNGPGASTLSMPDLLNRLQSLYRGAEQATEKYNGLVEQLGRADRASAALTARIAAKQHELDGQQERAGALAREEYRQSGTFGLADLLAGENPADALDAAQALRQAGGRQKTFLTRLRADRAALAALKTKSDKALKHARDLANRQKSAKAAVQARLNTVEALVMSLTGTQLDELRKLEQEQIDAAQKALLGSGALGHGERYPSAAGTRAIAYAVAQVGKPYLWGGTGPLAYDCSGLTSQAWAHAGRPIPRTSQEQWAGLTRVPLSTVRPGDLVIYFAGATHVGMYVGNGLIVEAPRPGAFVKIAPVASMPILGVVRPDAGAPSVSGGYRVPGASSRGNGFADTPIAPAAPQAPTAKPTPRPSASAKPAPKPRPKPKPKPTPTPKPSASKSASKPSPSASASTGSPSPSASESPAG